MTRTRNRYLRLAIFVSAGLFMACASTTMQSAHRSPDFRSAAIHHVLVIGMFKDAALRKTFEAEFVRQWSLRGVAAVSSLEVLPSSTTLDEAGVAPWVKAQGYDAVLVARVLAQQIVSEGVPPAAPVPASQNDIVNTDTVLQVLLAPPVHTSPYDLVTVRTNLYDVASGKRVWSGTSETEVMGNIPKLIPPFVKLILKRLYENP